MHNLYFHDSEIVKRKLIPVVLALSVLSGFVLGTIAGSAAGETFALLMRGSDFRAVPIVSLGVYFFPFLISAIAVFISWYYLLPVFGFLKAFSMGVCGAAILYAYKGAGMMIYLLLMFSDLFLFPVLCWFWLRHGSGGRRTLWKDLAVCTAAVLFVGGLNIHMISPFLARLI